MKGNLKQSLNSKYKDKLRNITEKKTILEREIWKNKDTEWKGTQKSPGFRNVKEWMVN